MGSKSKKRAKATTARNVRQNGSRALPAAQTSSIGWSDRVTAVIQTVSGLRFLEPALIALSSLFSYWLLTTRLTGVTVSVLVDEYSYVLDAHYRGLTEAAYPNHLFQLVYATTAACGVEFYSCARNLNAVFVIAGAIFIYLLAKHVSGRKWLGALAAWAAVLGSYGTYTAYFMPEAIFNFPMIVFFWALVRFGKSDNLLAWAGFGLILGVASLAKPHAFFVVPAIVVFIFLWTRATKESFLLPAAYRISTFVAVLLISKFALGYLIAGPKGLSIFGSYGGAIATGEAVATTLGVNTWLNVPQTSWGQTMMITMVLGVALPVVIAASFEVLKKDPVIFEVNRVRSLVGISLVNMMAVSAVFEAWQNLNTWMHTRYYSYLIPLAVVALVEAYAHNKTEARPLLKRAVVAIFVLLSLVALITAGMPFGANWIDAPDFRFHIDNLVLSSALIIVSALLAIWWLWDNKKPILVALVLALATSTLSGAHISNYLVSNFSGDSVHDQLGRVLRNYLTQSELDKTVLIGDNNTAMERALFTARTGGATRTVAPDTGFDISDLDPDTRWLIKVGEPTIFGLGEPVLSGVGYSFFSLDAANSMKPRLTEETAYSSRCTEAQHLGWSCGNSTEISKVQGFGPGSSIDLIIEVSQEASLAELEFVLGDSVLTGTLPPGLISLNLNFSNVSENAVLVVRSKAIESMIGPAGGSAETKFIRVVSLNTWR